MTRRPDFRDLAQSSKFTFVRHGESEGNRQKVMQGLLDFPLSAEGRDHARAAGQWLRSSGVDLVLSSPLARSSETAVIMATEAGAPPPELMDELRELDVGTRSGKGFEEWERNDPESFRRFRMLSWDGVEGAESRESLYARAVVVWNRLIREANGGRRHIVCVTHGGMIQWIIKATIGGPEQRWMPVFGMSNCGVSTFIAESTSREVEDVLPPNTGFFGNWRQINYVPY